MDSRGNTALWALTTKAQRGRPHGQLAPSPTRSWAAPIPNPDLLSATLCPGGHPTVQDTFLGRFCCKLGVPTRHLDLALPLITLHHVLLLPVCQFPLPTQSVWQCSQWEPV